MICASYKLYNGDPSSQVQSFTDCNGNICSVTIDSGSRYFITADLTSFTANPLLTVTTYNIDRAFSFSSCCTNDVFHILGDSTTIPQNQIGRTVCVKELTDSSNCSINNTLVKNCYSLVSIDRNIADALGNQVYFEYSSGFVDCNTCFDDYLTTEGGCIPCCKCYQVDVIDSDGCVISYLDCDTGLVVTQVVSGLNNFICSATVPDGSACLSSPTITDLGPCSTTEACITCPHNYCITNTGYEYDDTYSLESTYDGYSYWVSNSGAYYIYYNTTDKQWCLSTSLGGNCLLSGKSPCFSKCPDLCEEYFY